MLLGDQLVLLASPAHLDRSVRTGIPGHLYRRTRLFRLGRLAYMQTGGWWTSLRAETLIVDLNPRSLTGWMLLLSRRVANRRTLVWGHLHPRSGPESKTAPLRRFMRSKADGFVAYTYAQAVDAVAELPAQPVWVAPNALYRRSELLSADTAFAPRTDVLYVGRLEQEKRVEFIAEAFVHHSRHAPDSRLTFVGSGASEGELRVRCDRLGITNRTTFAGWVDNPSELRAIYARAFCSVSAGFAGLGLTQSLGFGVPQLVADDQVHSPEIELASLPSAVTWFDGSSAQALGDAMSAARDMRSQLPLGDVSRQVSERYSAEAMSAGLRDAFENRITSDV